MSRGRLSAAEVRQGLLASEQPRAIEEIRGWVAAMIYGAGWGLSDPEAVIQDVTLRVVHLGRTGRIRADTDFKSFVLTIARHTCTDTYRHERLRDSIEAPPPVIEPQASAGRDPHEALEERERLEPLRFVFQALPEDCRRLWRWVYGDGLAAAQVAERLGVSPVNARVRVHRCLKKAREHSRRYLSGAGTPLEARTHGG
jgi:RNA polymerase sigma factor (sigma-70 family)